MMEKFRTKLNWAGAIVGAAVGVSIASSALVGLGIIAGAIAGGTATHLLGKNINSFSDGLAAVGGIIAIAALGTALPIAAAEVALGLSGSLVSTAGLIGGLLVGAAGGLIVKKTIDKKIESHREEELASASPDPRLSSLRKEPSNGHSPELTPTPTPETPTDQTPEPTRDELRYSRAGKRDGSWGERVNGESNITRKPSGR